MQDVVTVGPFHSQNTITGPEPAAQHETQDECESAASHHFLKFAHGQSLTQTGQIASIACSGSLPSTCSECVIFSLFAELQNMNQPNLDFSGRVALVTGGSRGIGRACCKRLAECGADVAVNYRANKEAAQESAAAVEQAGARSIIVQADVADADAAGHMVSKVEDHLGPIDLLVNNAGIFDVGSHKDITADLWQQTIDCNLTGTYHVTWAVKDGMINRGFGRIVNIASIAALAARPHAIAYSVSKAGMIALTQSLSSAIAAHGIRVNAVAPGLIDTEILNDTDPSLLDNLIKDTPMGRMGQPDEVADTVLFLLSDLSRFTTGQTVVCSGGRVLLP